MKTAMVFWGILIGSSSCLGQIPTILTEPQDQTNLLGKTALLSVVAAGGEPLSYQWQRNGWALAGCTTCLLELTNLRASDSAGYSVTVTNSEGSVTSRVAQLTVVSPPVAYVRSASEYAQMAVYRGSNLVLTVGGSGTQPLSYKWRLGGKEIAGAVSRNYAVTNAQPGDEGDYTVCVSNPWGSVTSAPARVYVTPPATQYVKSNFINAAQQRLPYFLLTPDEYDPQRQYPLVCVLHGTPGSEEQFGAYVNLGPQAIGAVYNSYQRQQSDPAIVVWPARRDQDGEWTEKYIQQLVELVDFLCTDPSVDTNRVYILGMSEGVHAVWDCLGSRPNTFAGAVVLAGWAGSSVPNTFRDIPIWAFCAAGDSLVNSTRALVKTLRLAGSAVLYTEYSAGNHMTGIATGLCTPAGVEWLMAQKRGEPPAVEPLLRITEPTSAAVMGRAGTKIDLGGWAQALGQPIDRVSWTNFANTASGTASGLNDWTVTGVPLKADRTNTVVIVASTTSFASPYFGGATTFSDALRVECAPIRLSLMPTGTNFILNWQGGGAPYSLQSTPKPSEGGIWTELRSDATPPIIVPLDAEGMFYRVIGR